MKTCTSSITPASRNAPSAGAALHQHIGHAPPAQLGQQRLNIGMPVRGRRRQHLAPQRPQRRDPLRGRLRRRRNQRRNITRRPRQRRAGRKTTLTIQNDADGGARSRRARRQLRVVGQGRAGADDHRVHPAAQRVRPAARRLVADPFRVAAPRGDLAVERHGPFGVDVGLSGRQQRQVGRVEPPRRRLAQSELDRDAGLTQPVGPLAGHRRKRIAHGGDHARHAARRIASVQGGVLPW